MKCIHIGKQCLADICQLCVSSCQSDSRAIIYLENASVPEQNLQTVPKMVMERLLNRFFSFHFSILTVRALLCCKERMEPLGQYM